MENTPTGHADDLLAILGIFINDPKSRSVNILLQLDFDPNRMIFCSDQPKLRPVGVFTLFRIVKLIVLCHFAVSTIYGFSNLGSPDYVLVGCRIYIYIIYIYMYMVFCFVSKGPR